MAAYEKLRCADQYSNFMDGFSSIFRKRVHTISSVFDQVTKCLSTRSSTPAKNNSNYVFIITVLTL